MMRQHIYFSGHVQGVGFRWTTRRLANDYEVTGWVKNLPDGRVELLVEGEKAELKRFLSELRRRLGQHIRDENMETQEASGQFQSFEIRH